MAKNSAWFASQLRQELAARSRIYARGRAHVESYGSSPVIVYTPENGRHGNFFDPAYAAIVARPSWERRLRKAHAQARRALPKAERPWCELDSSMSSDALLMNIFCTPGVADAAVLRNTLGVEENAEPEFGWKARVPLANGRFDRTEVDMRFGSLLVEAKLTEGNFQTRAAAVVEGYRDLDVAFDRDLLPRIELPPKRWREAAEFPEDYTQEGESIIAPEGEGSLKVEPPLRHTLSDAGGAGYANYQLIRNVLAAYAAGCSLCVLHDERRPDLREEWYQVMAAVKSAEMRVRLKVMTWQELAALVPESLQEFLNVKYGIAAPGRVFMPSGDGLYIED
jgi:hypothetical protein